MKLLHTLFAVNSFPLPPGKLGLVCGYYIQCFLEFHVMEQCVTSFTSHNTVLNYKCFVSSLFFYCWGIVHNLTVTQPVNSFTNWWYSDSFQLEAILNKAFLNIPVQVFMKIYVHFSWVNLMSEAAKLYGKYISNVTRKYKSFFKVAISLKFHPTTYELQLLKVLTSSCCFLIWVVDE
jgi:hypothetical protein